MYCRSCGENIPVDSIFCPSCGKNLIEVSISQPIVPPPAPPSPDPVQLAEETDETDATPLSRRRRMRRSAQSLTEEDPFHSDDDPRAIAWPPVWLQNLTLSRLLWGMGLIFAAVGFIVGLLGHLDMALAWLLFGLVMIVAGPSAPQLLSQEPKEPSEDTSIEEEMGD